jgi:hypothetical protein
VDKVIVLIGITLMSAGLFSLWWLRMPPSGPAPMAQPLPEQSF